MSLTAIELAPLVQQRFLMSETANSGDAETISADGESDLVVEGTAQNWRELPLEPRAGASPVRRATWRIVARSMSTDGCRHKPPGKARDDAG
jgi:hypothetical protein